MSRLFSQPIAVFLLLCLGVSLPLFLFPINLFPGEIVLNTGVGQSTVSAPLSLSYFVGIGYAQEDLQGIKDFYLLPEGIALACILTVGIPAILAFRIHLRRSRKSTM